MRPAIRASIACAAACTGPVLGGTITVPGDHPTIQAAIDAAVDGDQIVVAQGVYPEHIDLLGKAVMLRSTAPSNPIVVGSTIIFGGNNIDAPGFPQSPGAVVTCENGEDASTLVLGLTIIGGGSIATPGAAMRIVDASPTVANCRFANNVVINGDGGGVHVEGSESAFLYCEFIGNVSSVESGGAMSVEGGAPSLFGCLFRENEAGNDGGAVRCFDSNPLLIECTFEDNVAQDRGGGLYAFDTLDQTTTMIVDCRFTGNQSGLSSPSGHGGGAYLGVGNSSVSGSEFIQNAATSGGGLHASRVLTGACSVDGCTFEGNLAVASGGGMNVSGIELVTVTRSSFTGNESQDRGGGLATTISGVRVFNCWFEQNAAEIGGAVVESGISLFSAVFANCVLDQNDATQGGAFAIRGSSGSATIANCTLVGNTATLGGALQLDLPPGVPVAVRNSILWGNSAPVGSVGWVGAQSTLDVAYCNVEGGQASIVESGGILVWGSGNIESDPLFVDPDNGDYRPGPVSPGIDAGINSAVPADAADLDGDGDTTERLPVGADEMPRFVDHLGVPDAGDPDLLNPPVDIGAYEFQFVPDPCPADIDGDGAVAVLDVVEIILGWGQCPAPPDPCPADLNGDGTVGVQDLIQVMVNWGPCD